MKFRLFFIIWIACLLTASTSALVFAELLRRERINNLDSQIKSLSALLINSEVVGEGIAELKEADDLIQGIIGTYRLGLVVILKNRNQRIIYRSKNAQALGLNPSIKQEWQFVKHEDDLIRLHTSTQGNKILQLGLVADQEVLRPSLWTFLFSGYSLALLIVSGILAYVLTLGLLTPLRRLSRFLNELTRNFDPEGRNTQLPKAFIPVPSGPFGRFDEFQALLHSLNQFLDHLEASLKIHGTQAALLAHEINTPLTVAINRLSLLKPMVKPEEMSKVFEIEQTLSKLGEFVRRYLQLAEAVHQPLTATSIFAIKMEEFLPPLVERLRELPGGERLQIKSNAEFTLFTNMSDLEQTLSNLIRNALRYGDSNSPIEVTLSNREVSIQNRGVPIPEDVLRRLGEPFNKSKQGGSGLGLAWVKAICRKYDWSLEIAAEAGVTQVKIQFPEDSLTD